MNAKKEDLYLSGISPLGVPFNTVSGTASEAQKNERVENGRPGSPCPKGFLKLYNTHSTENESGRIKILKDLKKLMTLLRRKFLILKLGGKI